MIAPRGARVLPPLAPSLLPPRSPGLPRTPGRSPGPMEDEEGRLSSSSSSRALVRSSSSLVPSSSAPVARASANGQTSLLSQEQMQLILTTSAAMTMQITQQATQQLATMVTANSQQLIQMISNGCNAVTKQVANVKKHVINVEHKVNNIEHRIETMEMTNKYRFPGENHRKILYFLKFHAFDSHDNRGFAWIWRRALNDALGLVVNIPLMATMMQKLCGGAANIFPRPQDTIRHALFQTGLFETIFVSQQYDDYARFLAIATPFVCFDEHLASEDDEEEKEDEDEEGEVQDGKEAKKEQGSSKKKNKKRKSRSNSRRRSSRSQSPPEADNFLWISVGDFWNLLHNNSLKEEEDAEGLFKKGFLCPPFFSIKNLFCLSAVCLSTQEWM